MKSMTGFGKAEILKDGYFASVELKSVNHRFLDISVKMPRVLSYLEERVKKTVSSVLARGHVDVYISCENRNESAYVVTVNEALASQYLESARAISEKLGVPNDVTASFLMKQPDVISTTVEAGGEELGEVVIEAVKQALEGMERMRTEEGKALACDFVQKLATVSSLVESVRERSPLVTASYAEKLKTKIKDYLAEVEPDEARLLTEVAVFTDRSSVDEEVTRLTAHVEHFLSILEESAPVGRKLDFLVQEMNRECNTIGSKANDKTITDYVLSLKTEVEKIREQVQNVE